MTTGCWGARELNELAITTGLAIDKKGDEYEITAQVVVPSEMNLKGGGDSLPVTTFHTVGKTLWEAGRKLVLQSSRQIYVGHLQIIVFGEEVVREGIGNITDLFFRFQEMRPDILLLVAKGRKGSDILKVLPKLEANPSIHLKRSIRQAEKLWAPAVTGELGDLISSFSSEGKNPVITDVVIKGSLIDSSDVKKIDPPTKLRIDGLAALKKDRLVGYLNEYETQGFNYITDNVQRIVGHVECKGGETAIEIMRNHSDVKSGGYKNGQPLININVEGEGSVGEVNCDIDLTNPSTIAELERKIEEKIKQRIQAAIHKAQTELRTDVFGFGEKIRRTDPKEWKKLKKKWEHQFPFVAVDIKVKINIKDTRVITNPILKGKHQ
jgi:spore germination protein KC